MRAFRLLPALLVAAALGREAEPEVMCSSLDGPRCGLMGSSGSWTWPLDDFRGDQPREQLPPKTPTETTTTTVPQTTKEEAKESSSPPKKEPSWRERLESVVQKHLREGSERGRFVEGSFRVRGAVQEDGTFHLAPGAWIAQPKGWITVGLRGAFETNVTVSGEIVDEDGVLMDVCSRFALRRTDDSSFAQYSLAGDWAGVYHCGGTPTRLLLKLREESASSSSHVEGVFEFAVLNDLDDVELKELAHIVSDTLLDEVSDSISHLAGTDLADTELQVIVVDLSDDDDTAAASEGGRSPAESKETPPPYADAVGGSSIRTAEEKATPPPPPLPQSFSKKERDDDDGVDDDDDDDDSVMKRRMPAAAAMRRRHPDPE